MWFQDSFGPTDCMLFPLLLVLLSGTDTGMVLQRLIETFRSAACTIHQEFVASSALGADYLKGC